MRQWNGDWLDEVIGDETHTERERETDVGSVGGFWFLGRSKITW